jgi:hypothetical protein
MMKNLAVPLKAFAALPEGNRTSSLACLLWLAGAFAGFASKIFRLCNQLMAANQSQAIVIAQTGRATIEKGTTKCA